MTRDPRSGNRLQGHTDEVISDADVRHQLDRILDSPGFAGSVRLKRFLRYVVEQQLAGEGAKLKEYAIGVEVFDRKEPYDPRLDSIVRVEAGRLRSKLDEVLRNRGRGGPSSHQPAAWGLRAGIRSEH